jgi:hypothetical protein
VGSLRTQITLGTKFTRKRSYILFVICLRAAQRVGLAAGAAAAELASAGSTHSQSSAGPRLLQNQLP